MAVLAATPALSQERGADPGAVLSEYTVGVYLLESDAPARAIPHLETAWALGGPDADVGIRLAEAYYRVGDLDACVRVLDAVLEVDATFGPALLLSARAKHVAGDPDGALEYIARLRLVAGPTFEGERLAGRIHLEAGREAEALDAYLEAVSIDSSYPFLHHRVGMLFRRFERDEEAEASFRHAIELFPDFMEAVVDLAELLIAEGRLDDAQAVLGTLLARDGVFSEAAILAASLYAERGQNEEAIGVLAGRVSELPRAGVILLGRLYYESAHFDEAFGVFKNLYESEPDNAELARVLGEISLKSGRANQALTYYRKAIEIEPNNFRNYLALFFVSSPEFQEDNEPLIQLRPGENVGLLDAAAARVPADDAGGIYVLGVAYQAVGDFRSSRDLLERALALSPDDEKVQLNLAGALEKLGHYSEAEAHLSDLHDRHPEDPAICNFYGYVLTLLNQDLDKAETLIRTALRQEPDNGYYVDSLGWLYYQRGDYKRAVEEIQRAVQLAGPDAVMYEHLGDAYWSMNEHRKALAAYEQSMELRGRSPEILDKIEAVRAQLGD